MMFVVEGGNEKLQQRVTERRNIHEDYKRPGEEPAMIPGVVIMTDIDNTRKSAIARYGDIVFTGEQASPH